MIGAGEEFIVLQRGKLPELGNKGVPSLLLDDYGISSGCHLLKLIVRVCLISCFIFKN